MKEPPPQEVRFDELCIVAGCLHLRIGRNLCRGHQRGQEPRELHRCPACMP
jgi:hypothetical protein